jgi:ATP-dependent DNA ligase
VNEPFSTRVKLLSDVLTGEFPSIFQNTVMEEWDDSTIDELWEAGIEGAILKNVNSVYIPGKRRANTWYKVKSELTADVVVVGFTEANEGKTGKFAGKIGAIRFGAYTVEGVLVEIGQCSGMSDAERDRWTEIRDMEDITPRVIEVKYNDLVGSGEYGTPRHPQFKTERVDKRPEDCLMEQFRM